MFLQCTVHHGFGEQGNEKHEQCKAPLLQPTWPSSQAIFEGGVAGRPLQLCPPLPSDNITTITLGACRLQNTHMQWKLCSSMP